MPEAVSALPTVVFDTLASCELILHCGDLHTIDVLDALERIAPVKCSRGNGDTLTPTGRRPGVPSDPRVTENVVIEVAGLRLGMTHDLERVEGRDDAAIAELLEQTFGTTVDLAVCGHTHVPLVWGLADGTVLINPGSATMPYGYLGVPGTVGILEISDGRFVADIIDLSSCSSQLHVVGPGRSSRQVGPRPIGGR